MKPFTLYEGVHHGCDRFPLSWKVFCLWKCEPFTPHCLSSHWDVRQRERLAKICCSNFDVFCLTPNESTDMKDTAQLAILICGNTATLQVYEEFLQLVPLHSITTGQDIFSAVLQCVKQHSLDLSRLMCMTTDGVPAMTGERKGAASLLVCHCESAGHTSPSIRCTASSTKSPCAPSLHPLPQP